MKELQKFLKDYEEATNSHDFDNVAPFLSSDAVYWFSDGSFEGTEAIRGAFDKAWGTIQNEVYGITNVRWIATSPDAAVCIYDFTWQGVIDGADRSGGGRGTNAFARTEDGWKMTHEHLSNYPAST
jgi:ketosteroid isomerase-like protein